MSEDRKGRKTVLTDYRLNTYPQAPARPPGRYRTCQGTELVLLPLLLFFQYVEGQIFASSRLPRTKRKGNYVLGWIPEYDDGTYSIRGVSVE